MSENLESDVSIENDVSNELVEDQVDVVVDDEIEAEEVSAEVNQDEADGEDLAIEDDEDQSELSERLGSYLSAERKRLKAHHNQEIAQLKQEIEQLKLGTTGDGVVPQPFLTDPVYQHAVQSGFMQDPVTGQVIETNSVKGQMILREMELNARQQQDLSNNEMENKRRLAEEFQDKVARAHLTYKDFGSSYQKVDSHATQEIAEALVQTDVPAAIINFLGKNPGEIQKIAAMPSGKQAKEIYKLEDRVVAKRKLTTNAPAPVKSVNSTRNTGASVSNQTIDQRAEAIRNQFFGGRKYGK